MSQGEFWAIVIGILAIIVSIAIPIFGRRRKLLSYQVISKSQLLSVDKQIEGKIQVLFDGKPTLNVRLFSIRITNNGNVAIPATDYERDLSFGFGEGSEILSSSLENVSSHSLKPGFEIIENRVRVKPLLLTKRSFLRFLSLYQIVENSM